MPSARVPVIRLIQPHRAIVGESPKGDDDKNRRDRDAAPDHAPSPGTWAKRSSAALPASLSA